MPAPSLLPETALTALASFDELMRDLLAVSLTGVIFYAPLYDSDGEVVDFRFVYLNDAAQRMMRMPAQPTLTHMEQWPQSKAHGTFAFHVDAFVTGEPRYYEVNYQADGYDNYYRLAARRSGQGLLVSFTDTADHTRTPVEIALRESQARERAALAEVQRQRAELQRLFEQAPVGLAVFMGPRYVVRLANSDLLKMWGRTHEQAVDTPLFDLLPEAAGQGFEELLDQVMATNIPYVASERPSVIERNGRRETVYWNFVYQPLREEDGRVAGVTVVATAVTLQVTARQQLEQLNQQLEQLNRELESRVQSRTRELQTAQAETEAQRQRLHRLIAEAPAMIARLRGPDHRVELVNDGFRRTFGERELLGKTYREAVPELDGQSFFALLDEVYRTGQTHHAVDAPALLDRTNSGRLEQVYFDYTYQVTRDGSGVIDGILIFAYDVTERVMARREREIQQQHLESLFMQAPAAISILAGAELRYELVNPSYQALFPDRDLLGRPILEALPEIADHAVYHTLREVFESGQSHEETGMRVPLVHPRTRQLEDRYFNYIQQARHNAHGQIDGVLVFAFEITDQVRARQEAQTLAAELLTANAQLTRTNIDLDNFIYTASHDLRAPIANIEGLLRVLEELLPSPIQHSPEMTPVLTMMHESVTRFTRTIGHLSDVTKLQKEYAQPTTEVTLAEVIDDVLLDLAPQMRAAAGEVSIDVAACPSVYFSLKNLRSVVYNLLSNALKYRHPDRLPVVRIASQGEEGYDVLSVQDNGLGLSADQQGELFTMFRRLHTHVEGSGIGLYMVKRSVENVGGRISVWSEPGKGSTFFVYFPR